MAIKKVCKLFTVLNELNVEVLSFNTDFFNTEKEVVITHSLMLSNFVESDFNDFLDFLKDSVENNFYLNDYLKEISFKVKNDVIEFLENGEEYKYQNMGEYTINGYRIFVSGGYSFIEDLIEEKKYLYYGD